MPVLIGTSGWQYRHWDGSFYPPEVPKGAQLAWYAERFQVVETNATFYRLPEAGVFRAWSEQTPADFVFAVKASRFLTHLKRLKDPEEPIERLLGRARELGGKLGPVLLQLPPQMHRQTARLEAALEIFCAPPHPVRVAVEPRHESWFADEVRQVLARHGAALCFADRGARLVTPDWRTADWGYLRFHGGDGWPPGCYGRATLEEYARLAAALWGRRAEVYAFFNNDFHRCALRDAGWFAEASAAAGLEPARTVAAAAVAVG
jgi:uncharacterized protein YecE (DUF72 family)